jgi:hypothetical protein
MRVDETAVHGERRRKRGEHDAAPTWVAVEGSHAYARDAAFEASG